MKVFLLYRHEYTTTVWFTLVREKNRHRRRPSRQDRLGPPPLSHPMSSPVAREVGTHKVVATMKHSNNVSPASPYLIDIRFGVDEGPMKICSVRSVGFEILVAVGVFIRGNNQLALFTIISTPSC